MSEDPKSILDLSQVLTVLKPLESKWHDLGIHLGIKDEILESIEADHHSVGRCFSKMISFWQRNEQDPSWEKLADAVEKVGEYSNVVRSIRGDINPPTSKQDQDSGYGSSSHSASDSEQDVFGTSSLSPGCGCGQCGVHKMCTKGCPRPDCTKRLPILTKYNGGETASESASKRHTSYSHQNSVEYFEQETADLCKHFGRLVTNTRRSLERLTDKDEVALHLLNSFPILKRKEDEINQAPNMTKLFAVVTVQACSWFNFDIVKELINMFGNDDDYKRLADYECKFQQFAKQRLPQGMTHVELGSKAGMTGCKKLVIKVDREWESISIGELDRLRGEFAKTLGTDRKNLYLADVNEGCIMLTLMVPEEIASSISQRRLTSAQKQLLAEERVVRVTCGKLKWSRSSTASSDSDEDIEERPKMKFSQKTSSRPTMANAGTREMCLILIMYYLMLHLMLFASQCAIPPIHLFDGSLVLNDSNRTERFYFEKFFTYSNAKERLVVSDPEVELAQVEKCLTYNRFNSACRKLLVSYYKQRSNSSLGEINGSTVLCSWWSELKDFFNRIELSPKCNNFYWNMSHDNVQVSNHKQKSNGSLGEINGSTVLCPCWLAQKKCPRIKLAPNEQYFRKLDSSALFEEVKFTGIGLPSKFYNVPTDNIILKPIMLYTCTPIEQVFNCSLAPNTDTNKIHSEAPNNMISSRSSRSSRPCWSTLSHCEKIFGDLCLKAVWIKCLRIELAPKFNFGRLVWLSCSTNYYACTSCMETIKVSPMREVMRVYRNNVIESRDHTSEMKINTTDDFEHLMLVSDHKQESNGLVGDIYNSIVLCPCWSAEKNCRIFEQFMKQKLLCESTEFDIAKGPNDKVSTVLCPCQNSIMILMTLMTNQARLQYTIIHCFNSTHNFNL